LALTFGTLLSSQGTDTSFVLTPTIQPRLSSGRFPSVFPTLADPISVSATLRRGFAGLFSAFAFPFPAVPTVSDPFGADSPSAGVAVTAVGPFRRG
ncbi:hypothetical protein, partial [Streptomyces physcomitrii]|uniref:hypothetical protein n=1 Tax=Streptomyces physcomitrii TaxID=2724184 RepID=UPI00379F638B